MLIGLFRRRRKGTSVGFQLGHPDRALRESVRNRGGAQAGELCNRLTLNADRLSSQPILRPERTMELIIEARIVDGTGEVTRGGIAIVATVNRRDKSLAQSGLTLMEGRSLRLGSPTVLQALVERGAPNH